MPDDEYFLYVTRASRGRSLSANVRARVTKEVTETFAWYFGKPVGSIPVDAKIGGIDSRVMFGLIDRIAQRLNASARIDGAVQNRYRAGKIGSLKDLIDAFTDLIEEDEGDA